MKGLLYRMLYIIPIAAVTAGGWLVDSAAIEESSESDSENSITAMASTIGSKVLNLAHEKAAQSSFHDAIQLLRVIPENDPHFEQVATLKNQWSGEILKRGLDRIKHRKIREAIAILRFVPEDSSVYAIASAKLRELESEHRVKR